MFHKRSSAKLVRERSILAVRIAKFGQLSEPIRIYAPFHREPDLARHFLRNVAKGRPKFPEIGRALDITCILSFLHKCIIHSLRSITLTGGHFRL